MVWKRSFGVCDCVFSIKFDPNNRKESIVKEILRGCKLHESYEDEFVYPAVIEDGNKITHHFKAEAKKTGKPFDANEALKVFDECKKMSKEGIRHPLLGEEPNFKKKNNKQNAVNIGNLNTKEEKIGNGV